MSTGPRRLLVTALLSLLVGLGALKALFGRRRPPPRSLVGVEDLVPLPNPQPERRAGGRRGVAVGLVLLLLLIGLTGIVYESRDALFGTASRPVVDGSSPLAILPGPGTGARPPMAPALDAKPSPEAEAEAEASSGSRRADSSPPPATTPAIPAMTDPSFDIVRVDPNGDAVIAGRAAPNATVDLLIDGKPAASAKADAGGWFTLMPFTLPTGSSEIGLRAKEAQGAERLSSAKVAIVVAPSRDTKPLVAVTASGQPTLVLSQPDPPALTGPGAIARSGGPTAGDRVGRGLDATPGADRGEPSRAEGPVTSSEGSPVGAHSRQRDVLADGRTFAGNDRAEAPGSPARTANPDEAGDSRAAETSPKATLPKATPPKATPPKIVSIDAQEGGRLFVTARGAPGAALRLYLNDTLIAPARVGRDGTVTFTIGQGVRPGAYTVRLDLVDPETGKVRDRAEVPFAAPAPGRDDGVEYAAAPQDPKDQAARPDAPAQAGTGTAQADRAPPPSSTGSLAAHDAAPGGAAGAAEVYVPAIETARIVRGDSLWKISRRTYGEGLRYTLIYDANQDQIRDPDLIYPGQVFVLPGKVAPETATGTEGLGRRE